MEENEKLEEKDLFVEVNGKKVTLQEFQEMQKQKDIILKEIAPKQFRTLLYG